MLNLIKYLLYLLILLAVAFVLFAYAGPIFGIDFSTDMKLIELPLNLEID